MKKPLIIVIAVLCLGLFTSAWALAVDYTFAPTAGPYNALTTEGIVAATGTWDDTVVVLPVETIPFTFTFNETAYTGLTINPNGYLILGGTVSLGYTPISSTTTGPNVVSAFTRDLQGIDATSEIRYHTVGTTPNREFVVQWKNARKYNVTGDNFNFQIRLQETTNKAIAVFGSMTNNATATVVQVGLRGINNTDFKNLTSTTSWSAPANGAANSATMTCTATVFPVSGQTYTWTPPVAGTPPNPANLVFPTPSGVINISLTPTLSWASGGGMPTSYDVYWNGAVTPINQTATTYAPGTLAYSTTYIWQIVPRNEFGPAVGCPVWSFTTIPDPLVSSFPWSVDFGTLAAHWLPINWNKYSGVLADPTVLGAAGTGSWLQDDWCNVVSPLNKAAKINIYSTINGWLITPPIQMPGAGYQLEFDVAYMAWNGISTPPQMAGADDKFIVLIGDGTSWTPANVVRLWDNAGSPFVLNNINPAGEHITIDLSDYTGIRYIAFYGDAGPVGQDADNDLMVDNVLIRATPVGPPNPVTLNTPADAATGLPRAGFNLTWSPALTGGAPDWYAVYMSMDEGTIYGDVYFETTATFLNPTTYAGGPGAPITFNYSERWYWTVEAVNTAGSAVVEPPRWFRIEADPSITIPHTQAFAAATFPSGWTQTFSGGVTSNRWTVATTANAGGTANEMQNSWTSGIGISRLISPPINTNGIGSFITEFKHFFDDWGAGVTARLQYSHNLTEWFNTPWSYASGAGNHLGTITAQVGGLTQPVTYLGWTMDGDHYQYDYWYVDDVRLFIPLNWDVAPTAINMPQVVHVEARIPQATVINNGVNAASFNVRMQIGTYSELFYVNALGAGLSQLVSFPSFLPIVNTAYNVTVTTLLGTDQNIANDVLNGVLICLPLDVPAYADAAYDPAAVLDGPSSFNLRTPGTITDLNPTNPFGTNFMPGADWMGVNIWKGADYSTTSSAWWQIALDGSGTNLGLTGASLTGVAYDQVNNVTYASSPSDLYTISPAGVATLIGPLGTIGASTMIGIAYGNGVLYGVTLGSPGYLYTINTTTGAATMVGSLGINLNYAQDIAFDRNNGHLYLAGYTTIGSLYWIYPVNGSAWKIGDFQSGSELTGFAIPWGAVLPLDPPVVTITTGGLSWNAITGATGYHVHYAFDPYGPYTYLGSTPQLSWLDPTFPEAKKFYKVIAYNTRARTAPVMNGVENLNLRANPRRDTAPVEAGVFTPRTK
ncbi:MAG: hypothetical protein Q8M98_02080 [Candidatus Cloacimonadaceae bacterium]|nr:hypothetical protein [Candidatus Cloacimonadaceae bacterium]